MVQLIEIPLAFNEVLRRRAELAVSAPNWTNDDSSVVVYNIEDYTRSEIENMRLLNSSGKALIVVDAEGDDLDELMSNFLLTRLPGESDRAFRARLPDAFNQLNKSTDGAVRARAIQVDGVVDASISRIVATPYNGTVYIQETNFVVSTPAVRTLAQTHLNEESWKLWRDLFTVAAETRIEYEINGIVSHDGTNLAISTQVNTAVVNTEINVRRLGRVITATDYIRNLTVLDGVVSVEITFDLTATSGTTEAFTRLPDGSAANPPSTVYVGTPGTVTVTRAI